MNEKIFKDYLIKEENFTSKMVREVVESFRNNIDIANEFILWIKTRKFSDEPIWVEGYTAEMLYASKKLSIFGAFDFLIALREHRDDALKYLKSGLLRK